MIGWVPDPELKDAYPIATYTCLLVYKKYSKSQLAALQGLLNYSLTEGQKDAEPLGYIPLPATVVEKAKSAVDALTVM